MAENPTDVLSRRHGSASAAALILRCGRRALRNAVASGDVVRARRGLYVLPGLSPAQIAAAQVRGVVSHTSAAKLHGIEVAFEPQQVHVTVPRHRHQVRGTTARIYWANLGSSEVINGVTTPVRTVIDCARVLPFGEGLVIADSALANRLVTRAQLLEAAAAVRGPGRAAALRVATSADPRAGSPLESLLRAIMIGMGADFTPQVGIGHDTFFARVDFANTRFKVVVEGESYRHHGHQAGFERDCTRYTQLTAMGWVVLRFTWAHVTREPEFVREMIRAVIRPLRTRRRVTVMPQAA